jgi:serine phosphatase RsbU (regulator of sigma subunit)/ligand-binding sensor domain-containing protein
MVSMTTWQIILSRMKNTGGATIPYLKLDFQDLMSIVCNLLAHNAIQVYYWLIEKICKPTCFDFKLRLVEKGGCLLHIGVDWIRILVMKLCILIWLGLLFVNLQPFSEVGSPFVVNYDHKDFDAHPQCWDVVQDHRGVMFFGNTFGVLEFDSVNFRLIRLRNQSPARCLTVDNQGVVYVGGFDEFGYLAISPSNQLYYESLLSRLPEEERKIGDASGIQWTNAGLFVKTADKVIVLKKDGEFGIFNFPNSGQMLFVIHDTVYLYNQEGVYYFDNHYHLRKLPMSEAISSGSQHLIILPFDKNEILIYAEKKGFFVYNRSSILELRILPNVESAGKIPVFYTLPPVDFKNIENFKFFSGIVLDQHRYAFSSLENGICIVNKHGQLERLINKECGLQRNSIVKLYQDQSLNLWAISGYSGIAYVVLNSPISFFQSNRGLSDFVMSVIRYHDSLLVGSMGIYALEQTNEQPMYSLPMFNSIYKHQNICLGFAELNGSVIAMGSIGAIQLNNELQAGQIISKVTYCLAQSPKYPDLIFFGQHHGLGLMRMIIHSSKNHKFEPVNTFAETFTQIQGIIYKIEVDWQGDLWLTSLYNGIYYVRLHPIKMEQSRIFHYDKSHGLPGNYRNKVHCLDNQVIVGTSRGIFKAVISSDPQIDPKAWSFTEEDIFGKEVNRLKIGVDRIQRVNENHFYLFCYNDLHSWFVSLKKEPETNHFNYDPIPFKQIRAEFQSFLAESDGIVWMCTSDGLIRFDAKIDKNYQQSFHSLLRRVQLGNQDIVFDGAYQIFSAERNDDEKKLPNRLTLKYKDNSIRFEFGCSFYENTKDNQYSYFLGGLDRDWQHWTYETAKEYSFLHEGKYEFKLKAKNIFEQTSSISEFYFFIQSPWYRSYWAYLSYVALFSILVYSLIWLNTRRLLLAKQRLEKIVNQRTEQVIQQKEKIEIYAKNLYLTNEQLIKTKDALWGEMEIAKKIQTVLLPKKPQIPGYDLAVYMNPADEVGGDYYDVIEAKGRYWLVIGDVSGHGVPAGLIMMMAQTSIHSLIGNIPQASPEAILASVNRVIYQNIDKLNESKYMTITILVGEPNGDFLFSGLHQDILVFRDKQKKVEAIETRGMWLGMVKEIDQLMKADRLTLQTNDIILLYTDGLTEAVDEKGNMFSEQRLADLLLKYGHEAADKIKHVLIANLRSYQCADDVTFMIIKKT